MDITADQFKEDNKKQAADVVRQDLALDAWARHFDMKATEEDVHNEFAQADLDDPELIENDGARKAVCPWHPRKHRSCKRTARCYRSGQGYRG